MPSNTFLLQDSVLRVFIRASTQLRRGFGRNMCWPVRCRSHLSWHFCKKMGISTPQDLLMRRRVHVSGRSEIHVTPDEALVTFSVNVMKDTAEAARKTATLATDKVPYA